MTDLWKPTRTEREINKIHRRNRHRMNSLYKMSGKGMFWAIVGMSLFAIWAIGSILCLILQAGF